MARVPSRRSFLGSGAAVAGGVLGASALASRTDALPELGSTAAPKDAGEALLRLEAGNRRFVAGKSRGLGAVGVRRAQTAEKQKPFAIILSCSDSRVPPEIVFDQGIGDLFLVRVAGNTAGDPLVSGSIAYSATVLGSVLLMVLGHEDCGAVKAAIDVVTTGKQPPAAFNSFVQPIVPAVQAVQDVPPDQLLDAAVQENIRRAVASLHSEPPLAEQVAAGKLSIVGADYHLRSGKADLVHV